MLVSKAEFARTCHVSRAAIGKTNLPLVDGKIDTESPGAVAYVKSRKMADRVNAVSELVGIPSKMDNAKKGGRPKKKPQTIGSGETIDVDDMLESVARKSHLEVVKLEQQGINLKLKNDELRGKYANHKFYDEVFCTQHSTAVKKFMMLPEACIDGIIDLILDKGRDARADAVVEMTRDINEILQSTKSGWERNLERISSQLSGLTGDE